MLSSTTRRQSLAVLLIAASFLAGCATVKRQAFNAAAAPHVKTIVVAHPQNQDEYEINIVGHPGLSFGLIGGLVAAADMQQKATKLTQAIDPKETRIQERFVEMLSARLGKAGYEAVVVALPKDTKADDAFGVATQRAKGDAVLVVGLSGGYWAAGPSTDYFPRLLASVKTLDVKSQQVLYEDSISYGYAFPQAQTVHLASENVYRFASMDVLIADPVKTRQGLYVGLDAIAEQIVSDLKKP